MLQLSTISRWYDPLDLKPEDVDERDLAVSLSHLCRFNGHIEPFYSVAQHSIAVARLVEVRRGSPKTVLQALFHDASEAYLCGDIPGPLKKHLRVYTEDVREGYHGSGRVSESVSFVEWGIRKIIHEGLGCPPPTKASEKMVHQADRDTLGVEVLSLKLKHLHEGFSPSVMDPFSDALKVGLTHDEHGYFDFISELDRVKALLK